MNIYFLFFAVLFVIYLLIQRKIKTHINYPIGTALFFAMLVYFDGTLLKWAIDIMNQTFSMSLPVPPASTFKDKAIFYGFLLVAIFIFYLMTKNKDTKENSSQSNTFSSLINTGNVEQKNERK